MKTEVSRGAQAPKREQVGANPRLDASVYPRLPVHSVMEDRPAGGIVSALLAAHLKGRGMPGELPAPATQGVSAGIDGGGENSLQDAA